MTAEILSVGTELLLGDIINTNAAYIAKELATMGIDLYHQTVVGDNPERLSKFYECKIWIHYQDKDINAKNVVDLMANYLKKDSEVTLCCDGKGEEEALKMFVDFIETELNELPHK